VIDRSARILRAAGILAFAVACAAAVAARSTAADIAAAAREIDGQVFLEDAPIWLCDRSLSEGTLESADLQLVARTPDGRILRWGPAPRSSDTPAAWAAGGVPAQQLTLLVRGDRIPEGRLALVHPAPPYGYPAGAYELRPARGDSARALARFAIAAPRGSEAWVRAALSRARRLMDRERREEAAKLYEGVFERYPHTGYKEAVYLGLWQTRAYNRFGREPDLWLEEVFAHFHDTCFGVYAINAYVRDRGRDASITVLRQMAGIYTDTRMARAAAAWF
jgi:hypothetical protein